MQATKKIVGTGSGKRPAVYSMNRVARSGVTTHLCVTFFHSASPSLAHAIGNTAYGGIGNVGKESARTKKRNWLWQKSKTAAKQPPVTRTLNFDGLQFSQSKREPKVLLCGHPKSIQRRGLVSCEPTHAVAAHVNSERCCRCVGVLSALFGKTFVDSFPPLRRDKRLADSTAPNHTTTLSDPHKAIIK